MSISYGHYQLLEEKYFESQRISKVYQNLSPK